MRKTPALFRIEKPRDAAGKKGDGFMKRAWISLALCLLLTACAAPAAEPDGNWDPALKNALGLTPEQRLEDYDYFVKTLKDSYLCLGVHDRENPEDPAEEVFADYRKTILENDSDQAFYSAVYSSLYRLGPYGHLWIIEPEDYRGMLDWCRTEDTAGRERWKELIEASEESYKTLQAYLDALGDEGGGSWSGGDAGENLRTLLLPDAGVAYLKVDSFLADYDPDYQKEAQAIRDFYDAAGDCTDLIIDLTDNSGGNEGYWQDLLTAPLADEPLSCTNYALLADSENNRPYIDNVFAPSDLRPIASCPSWSGRAWRPPLILWRAPSGWNRRQSGRRSMAGCGCWWGPWSTPPASRSRYSARPRALPPWWEAGPAETASEP